MATVSVRHLTINGQDVSPQIGGSEYSSSEEIVEANVADGSGVKSKCPGLEDATMVVNFTKPDQSFSTATAINKIMWDGRIANGGTSEYTIVCGPSATPSVANPNFSFTALCPEYKFMTGDVGAIDGAQSVTFQRTGATTLVTS